MSENIYDYFRDNFGHSEDFVNDQIIEKYKENSKRSLKAAFEIFETVPGPNFRNTILGQVTTSEDKHFRC